MKKAKKPSVTVHIILRVIVFAILVRSFFRGDYEGVFYSILTLILFIVPSILEKSLKINLPSTLENIIFCFIFASEILGELGHYYLTVPHFDTVLHCINGFICAAVGFGLVDLLNRGKSKISLSPVYLCIVAFCFSMTIGVLWEFFEYFVDMYFYTDMQKDAIIYEIYSSKLDPKNIQNITCVVVNGEELGLGGYLDIGLHDTMKDLIVNFIGAVVFCFIGYFSLIGKSRGEVVRHLVPTVDEKRKKEI